MIAFGPSFEQTAAQRRAEADAYYEATIPLHVTGDARHVVRQAAPGLLWTKQFYHYVVKDWLEGDPTDPPPSARTRTRSAMRTGRISTTAT